MIPSNQINHTEELVNLNLGAEDGKFIPCQSSTLSDEKTNKHDTKIESMTKFGKIKKTALKWSKEVSFQAFPKMFDEELHLIIRFIWFVVFLAFVSITSFLIVQTILGYLQWGTVSTIEIIVELPTTYPAITICDSNPFTSKYAQTLLETLAFQKFNINITTMNLTEFNVYKENLTDYAKIVVNNPDFGDENKKLLGFKNFSDILLQKKYDLNTIYLGIDILWHWHPNYGNCYQFNGPLVKSVSHENSTIYSQGAQGDFYGLYINFGPLVRENVYPLSNTNGLKVFIHNQSHPQPGVFDTPISLESGKETNIILEKTLSSILPAPYGTCTDLTNGFNSDLYNYILGTNYVYRQRDCLNAGYQQEIQKECYCYWTLLPKVHDTPPCLNTSQLDCLDRITNSYNIDQANFIQRFIDRCPLECDTIQYDYYLSSLNYPAYETYIHLKTEICNLGTGAHCYAPALPFGPPYTFYHYFIKTYNIDVSTYDLYKDYFYSIKVFYAEATYTQITEAPQQGIVDLLSSLGGNLGMFLGFSIFSFVELLELLIKVIWILLKHKSNES